MLSIDLELSRAPRYHIGLTALYRHVDEYGVLLYVGVSNDPYKRLEQHYNAWDCWWKPYIHTMYSEWFSTRRIAERAERAAILREHPLFNRTGNKYERAPRLERAFQYLRSREAARHALFAAVSDAGHPDPLSRKARS